jgi:Ca-activated chloride channel family protein
MQARRALSGVALSIVTSFALAARGQEPPVQEPGFRSRVETVPVYATVLDRYGEIVRNIQRDEFDVYDEGRRQELTTFQAGLQPITAVVMVDTSASMTLNLRLALAAAEQFVIRMLPGDKVRVGSFSDRVDVSPEFTSDRDALLLGLRDMHFGNPTKLWDAVDRTITDLTPFGGRRLLLLLTDGMDTASSALATGVLARARASEAMFYVVQFRSSPLANMAEFLKPPSPSELFRDDRFRLRESPILLARLARQSGGGVFMLGQNDDINATFSQVMQELHYQYVLGFAPPVSDGRVHEIQVRVRRPGLTVRARQAYLAPSPPDVR